MNTSVAPAIVLVAFGSTVKETQATYNSIERAFRTLKSTLELRPMYHWTESRIRAHVFICVMALQIERYMRHRLAKSDLSVERAIQRLQTLKAGTLKTPAGTAKYLAAVQDRHKEILEQLQLPLPKLKHLEPEAL